LEFRIGEILKITGAEFAIDHGAIGNVDDLSHHLARCADCQFDLHREKGAVLVIYPMKTA
jgi:hypothetical protein